MFGIPDPTGRNLFGRDETGIADRRRGMITTAARWAAVWREANGPNVPPDLPPAPAVDLTRDAVIIASLGESPNHNWRVVIRGAALRHDTLFVVVRTDENVSPCTRVDNGVSPIAVGRVRRDGWRSVHFVDLARDRRCG